VERDLTRISIDGPFAAGARVSTMPFDQDPIELRITQTVENEMFVDEAAIRDVVIRTFHRIEPASERKLRVVYRLEISGPAAGALGPTLGPEITADFRDTIALLIERAEGKSDTRASARNER
jgi:hypothetical protein